MNACRAWVGVHRSRLAGAVLLAALLGSILCRSTVVDRVGGQQLVNPVALVLLVPTLAAAGVAIGCVGPTLPRPNPPRARIARMAWATLLTGLAFLACSAGPGASTTSSVGLSAVLRNVALSVTLAMCTVLVGAPAFAWFPPTMYAFVAMQFGSRSDGDVAAWAVFVDPVCTPRQLVIALAAVGIAIALHGVRQRESVPPPRGPRA